MRSFYDEPRTGSALIRDPLADDLVGSFSRHGKARESSMSGWAAAASEIHRGQVVSHVLAAVVAFALTVTRAVRRLRERLIGLSSQRKQTPKWKSTSRPGTAPIAPVAEGRLRLRARSEASPFGALTYWTRYGGLSAQHRRGSSLR